MLRGPFNGGGVNWAFDCVAHPVVTNNALEALDWEGTVVVIGVPSATAEFKGLYGRLVQVDRGIIGCRYGAISPHRDIPRIIELYRRGEVLLDELVVADLPGRATGRTPCTVSSPERSPEACSRSDGAGDRWRPVIGDFATTLDLFDAVVEAPRRP